MKRMNRIAGFALCAALLSSVITVIPAAAADSYPVYRLYNPNSGEHFYTEFRNEVYSLTSKGWDYEGVAWNSPSEGWYVWRLYNPNAGVHHYTMDEGEKNCLIALGWEDEGVGWASNSEAWADEDDAVGNPVYRLYNPNSINGDHHYTTSAGEADALIDAGWEYEGVSAYVD